MFRTSIRNKLMGLLLAATIIPIVTSIVFSYWYTKDSVTEESLRENANLLALGKNNVQSYMININQTSLSVYHNLNSPTSLFKVVERGTNGEGIDLVAQEFSNRSLINSHLLSMYQAEQDIYQIHLQILSNRQSYLRTRGYFRSFQKSDFELPPGAAAGDSTPFVEPTHLSTNYNVPGASFVEPEHVFTLHRPIIRTPSDEVIGFLSIDLRIEELFKIFKQLSMTGQENMYVIDHNSKIVYAENAELYGISADQEWVQHILDSDSKNGYFEWNDDGFSGMIIYDTIDMQYLNWTLIKQVPYASLYKDANEITRFNALIVAGFLIVVVVATLFISVHFTRPIKRLIGHMNKVQAGNLRGGIQAVGNDEIAILTRRFDAMLVRINDLINREYKLEIANVSNQLRAMQMQMNPHFLNNALQSIGTLALQHNAPKVYSLLSSLARMMRYNMDAGDTVVPLSLEINHMKDYLDLQQQRFEERLDVRFTIDEAVASVRVPKMILQPLVENFFKHGYEPHGGLGEIHVAASTAGDRLVIRVEDNGSGMPDEKLAELRHKLDHLTDAVWYAQDSIGLRNVVMRLRLHFGESTKIEIANRAPKGFMIELSIPISKGVDSNENIDRG